MTQSAAPPGFRSGPFAYHEEVELRIESLTNMGQGVSRTGDGWVVLVPFTIPGERVRARIFRNHKQHSDADLMEVLDRSPERVEAPCPIFGTCGGCQYQHVRYDVQLEWKRRQVAELLDHMAGISFPVDPVTPSPRQYAYRSKITPHFQKPKRGCIAEIGFLRSGQRSRIVDVPHCPIASDAINRVLPDVRRQAFERAHRLKNGATLLLRESADGSVQTEPGEISHTHVAGCTFRFLAGDFFQNNPSILDAFTAHVAGEAAGGGSRFLIDAYCGSGLFCLAAAPRFERALGIEISASSVDWARDNARRNGIDNAEFQVGEAENIFAAAGPLPPDQTTVVIDPPRKGCGSEFLQQLFAWRPARVVYVSCNPATQMRDLVAFRENDFALRRVQPFDLFPQTRHLECVMTLARAGMRA